MSERKVLNKYYPPDFDPSKIPKLRLPRNRQYSIRIMAPFNMRCDTCGEYIYKGKKFNSRKETVENEDYLGLKIFRFYIKCPCCVSEIAFKTDLKNTDYTLEAGAKRNFEAAKLAEEMEERSRKEKEEEELNNPMKVLENRTKASRQEMEQIDALEELKDLNMRHATVDHETMLKRHAAKEEILKKLQHEEDEKLIQSIFSKQRNYVKRLDADNEDHEPPIKKPLKRNKATDSLTLECSMNSSLSSTSSGSADEKPAWEHSVGLLSSKNCLTMLVKRKPKSLEENRKRPMIDKAEEVSKTATQISTSEDFISLLQKNVDVRNIPLPSQSPKLDTDNSKLIPSKTVSNSTSGLGLLGTYSDSDSDS